jgi:hypothetical protein
MVYTEFLEKGTLFTLIIYSEIKKITDLVRLLCYLFL